MEPMTLGSPTHSPSGSPNVGYLPPFLLGEINPPTLSSLSPRPNSLSPTKGRSLAFGSPTSPTQTSTPDQKMYRQNMSIHQQALYNQQQNIFANMPTSPNISYTNKTNGPPIEDLFDTIKSNEPSVNKSLFQENSFIGYGNNNSMMQNSYVNNISFNNQSMNQWQDGCQEQDEYWVTVFGFPPNAANTVLARFSNCGAILDKQYPTQGNWAHVRYSTRAEKERAMALNGRQVLPGVMVGVVECREPPRMTITSPGNVVERQTTARSLCPTPIPSAPVPQRSTGIISKALDYVLGW
ncbi:unnamed protein product [Euphydryas editha]|uniref:Nucleoporin NUP53 n=1 Tax=Euphydryas editha TaxID=104508 RepID=A0AAU9V9W6_EUPED|nr:unnamed protein product [Euphydryas editha]